jgi:hypothetical protein
MSLVPLEIAPAEAGRIKFRFRSGASSGSGSSSESAERQDEKAHPKSPDAAAAAATRARAALDSEKAAHGVKPGLAGTGPQPLPLGKTTNYSNGVTCLAGC